MVTGKNNFNLYMYKLYTHMHTFLKDRMIDILQVFRSKNENVYVST